MTDDDAQIGAVPPGYVRNCAGELVPEGAAAPGVVGIRQEVPIGQAEAEDDPVEDAALGEGGDLLGIFPIDVLAWTEESAFASSAGAKTRARE